MADLDRKRAAKAFALGASGLFAIGVGLSWLATGSGSGPSTTTSSVTPYSQGYAYGQRLDNEGYGTDEVESACVSGSRGSDEQGLFQTGCQAGFFQ